MKKDMAADLLVGVIFIILQQDIDTGGLGSCQDPWQVVMLRAGNLGRDMKCRNMCLYWTERIHGKGESVIWDEATAGAVRCVKE